VVAAEAMVELVLVDGVGEPGRQRLMRKLPADLEAAVAILVAGTV
jgi:acyl-CoA thioester hydrolase